MAGIELKPCPFCGSINLELTSTSNGCKVIHCADCGATMIGAYMERAVKKWNRRVYDD